MVSTNPQFISATPEVVPIDPFPVTYNIIPPQNGNQYEYVRRYTTEEDPADISNLIVNKLYVTDFEIIGGGANGDNLRNDLGYSYGGQNYNPRLEVYGAVYAQGPVFIGGVCGEVAPGGLFVEGLTIINDDLRVRDTTYTGSLVFASAGCDSVPIGPTITQEIAVGIISASNYWNKNNTGVHTTAKVGIGTTVVTSTLTVDGDSKFGGVIQKVSTATTYLSGTNFVLEMDVRQSSVYTYTMPANTNIGIISFRNLPAQSNNPTSSTVTLVITQNPAGNANVTAATGIGTNCTIVGYENGVTLVGVSTKGLTSSGSVVGLSTIGNDVDFISFFIQYNGGTNVIGSNYKVYVSKNGGFR